LKDAFDLHEEAVQEPEVAAGAAGDGGDGLGVGEVSVLEGQAELAPVTGQHEGEFVALQGAVVVDAAAAAVELRIAGQAFPMPGMPMRMTPTPVRSNMARMHSSAVIDKRSASSKISISTRG
jgi:hypothetical protein